MFEINQAPPTSALLAALFKRLKVPALGYLPHFYSHQVGDIFAFYPHERQVIHYYQITKLEGGRRVRVRRVASMLTPRPGGALRSCTHILRSCTPIPGAFITGEFPTFMDSPLRLAVNFDGVSDLAHKLVPVSIAENGHKLYRPDYVFRR